MSDIKSAADAIAEQYIGSGFDVEGRRARLAAAITALLDERVGEERERAARIVCVDCMGVFTNPEGLLLGPAVKSDGLWLHLWKDEPSKFGVQCKAAAIRAEKGEG
jgi:hypothetical protein